MGWGWGVEGWELGLRGGRKSGKHNRGNIRFIFGIQYGESHLYIKSKVFLGFLLIQSLRLGIRCVIINDVYVGIDHTT